MEPNATQWLHELQRHAQGQNRGDLFGEQVRDQKGSLNMDQLGKISGQTRRSSGTISKPKLETSLHEISNSITVIEDMNTQIATATEEQTLVAGEINQSIVDVNDKARETHSLSASNQEKASELIALSEKLTQAVSTFKLNS